jgi:hypothetical protein
MTMNAAEPGSTIDLTTISRAVAAAAAGVLHTVERAMVGDGHPRTARGNAWEAVCADRERARQRAEIRRMVAALTAEPVRPVRPEPAVRPVRPGRISPPAPARPAR